MKKILMLLMCCIGSMAQAAVVGEDVSYDVGGTTLRGYITYDDDIKGERPGVIVVHEWWGLNEYARMRARMLAKLGYTALAVDMYGEGWTADNPTDASDLAFGVSSNMPLEKERFEAGLEFLLNYKTVDPKKIAAFGYCFGGAVVLNMARIGENLRGVASFHGVLDTEYPAKSWKTRGHVISFSGEADPLIGPDKIAAFRQEMESAGVKYRVVTYPGAKHAFSNPESDEMGKKFSLPIAYNAEADKDSWRQATEFLREVFSYK